MAITYVAASNAAGQSAGTAGTSSTCAITPTLPTGTAAGDRVFVVQCHGSFQSPPTPALPTGWTAVGTKDTIIGTGSWAAGSGSRLITICYRDYDGVWTMPSFTLTSASNLSHWIGAVSVRKGGGDIWGTPTISTVGANYNTAGTSYTDTSAASFTTHTGGFLIAASCFNDNVTSSASAITQSGATFGTVTERCDGGTATGNDVAGKIHTCDVTAGASATITQTQTISAASQGETLFVEQTVSTAKIETFTDNFDAGLGASWYKVGTAAEINASAGGVRIDHPAAAGFNYLQNLNYYDLTGSYAYINVKDWGNQSLASHEVLFRLDKDSTNRLQMDASTDYLICGYYTAGTFNWLASIPLTTAMRWWRIRESGGTVYFDYASSPTSTWTNGASVANPWAVTLLTPSIASGCWATEATSSYAVFDNLNVPDPNLLHHLFTDDSLSSNFNAASIDSGGTWTAVNAGADPAIVTSAFDGTTKVYSQTTTSGTTACHALASFSDKVLYLKAKFRFGTGTTSPTVAFIPWENPTATAKSPAHVIFEMDSFIAQTYDASAGPPATNMAQHLYSSARGNEWQTVEIALDPPNNKVAIRGPDGYVMSYTTSLVSSLNYTYADAEVYYLNAATAKRGEFNEVWASTAAAMDSTTLAAYNQLLSDAAGGGTNYTPTITPEAVGITDSVVKDVGKTATDTVGVTDSLVKEAGRTATDLVGLTDSASKDAGRAATDLVGLTDSLAKDVSKLYTDPVGVTDSSALDRGWLATDQLGISDSATFQATLPKAGTLFETFATADTGKWAFAPSTAVVTGGQLVLVPTTGYNNTIGSVDRYDLTDSEVVVELVQRPNVGSGGIEAEFLFQVNGDADRMAFLIADSNLYIRETVAGSNSQTNVTYSATDHRWLRMRHSGSTIYWDASPNGQAPWTNLRNKAAAIPYTSGVVRLRTGYYGTEPTPGTAIWDNVNTPPSGVSYTPSATDTVGITDSLTKDASKLYTDLVGVTDAASAQQDWVRPATDLVGVVDSLAKDAGRTASDLVGVTDAVSLQQNWARPQTDSVGLTDSLTKETGRSATDPVGVTDSLTKVSTYDQAATDLVGVADSATFVVTSAGNLSAIDLSGITDSLSTQQSRVVSYTDLVGVTDSLSKDVGRSRDDSVGVSDLLAAVADYQRSWTDPVGVVDSASFALVAVGSASATDPVGVTDSASLVSGRVVAATDLVGLSDSAAFQRDYVRSLTDPVGVADSASFVLVSNPVRVFSDNVGISDLASFTLGDAFVSFTDLVGVTDSARFYMFLPPGADNSWVPRAEWVLHVPKLESRMFTSSVEHTSEAARVESATYVAKTESTRSEVTR